MDDNKTREKELQKDAFWSKIGAETAEISQFKDSGFCDFIVDYIQMFTEWDFLGFSNAKSNHQI